MDDFIQKTVWLWITVENPAQMGVLQGKTVDNPVDTVDEKRVLHNVYTQRSDEYTGGFITI